MSRRGVEAVSVVRLLGVSCAPRAGWSSTRRSKPLWREEGLRVPVRRRRKSQEPARQICPGRCRAERRVGDRLLLRRHHRRPRHQDHQHLGRAHPRVPRRTHRPIQVSATAASRSCRRGPPPRSAPRGPAGRDSTGPGPASQPNAPLAPPDAPSPSPSTGAAARQVAAAASHRSRPAGDRRGRHGRVLTQRVRRAASWAQQDAIAGLEPLAALASSRHSRSCPTAPTPAPAFRCRPRPPCSSWFARQGWR